MKIGGWLYSRVSGRAKQAQAFVLGGRQLRSLLLAAWPPAFRSLTRPPARLLAAGLQPHIVVATPGRLLDLAEDNTLSLGADIWRLGVPGCAWAAWSLDLKAWRHRQPVAYCMAALRPVTSTYICFHSF